MSPHTMHKAIRMYAMMYLPNRCMFANSVFIVRDWFWFVRIAISAKPNHSHIPMIDQMKSTGRYHTSGPNHICTPVYWDIHDMSIWVSPMTTTTIASFRNCLLVCFRPAIIAALILRDDVFAVSIFVDFVAIGFFFVTIAFFFGAVLLFIVCVKLKGDSISPIVFYLLCKVLCYWIVIGSFAMVCHSIAISMTLAPLLRPVILMLNTPSVIRLIDT